MQLLLVRHGETDWNIKRRTTNFYDIDLNATGVHQAKCLHDTLINRHIDICYCSPLVRSRHTAKILTNGHFCEIKENELITERNLGLLSKIGVEPGDLGINIYDCSLNTTAYGIESIKSMLARSKRFLNLVKQENSSTSTVLIVCHGGILHALTANIIGYDSKTDLKQFHYNNCELREFKV